MMIETDLILSLVVFLVRERLLGSKTSRFCALRRSKLATEEGLLLTAIKRVRKRQLCAAAREKKQKQT